MNKNIISILSVALGFIAAYFFAMSPAFPLPLWGKTFCVGLFAMNTYLSINAERWEEQGKFALHPILAFIVQVGLSFLILAITA
jgi:hypothetical protein